MDTDVGDFEILKLGILGGREEATLSRLAQLGVDPLVKLAKPIKWELVGRTDSCGGYGDQHSSCATSCCCCCRHGCSIGCVGGGNGGICCVDSWNIRRAREHVGDMRFNLFFDALIMANVSQDGHIPSHCAP